jgi:hypothetical protein
MSIGHYMKMILLVGGVTLLQAESKAHLFDVESGMVIYEISGGAQLTPETNLTIKGKAKLRFKEWGEVKLEEESGVVLTTGAIKHKQHVKRLEKHTKDTVITADYENEQLLERKKVSNEIHGHDETAFLTKKGQENVAGVLCDVWEGPGVKKCIYKNIVLKLESHVLDVTYVKEATKAVFDINASTEECEVPDYPIHEFALFKDNIKTKNAYKAENFCKVLKDVAFDVSEDNTSYGSSNIDDDERKKFINHIAKDIYERQKELLPALLQSLKETRACLQTGENPFEANECLENFSRMKAQLGTQEEDYIILWDEKRKNTLLDKIEEDLIDLQSRIPCVNRAKNITDLSNCMK